MKKYIVKQGVRGLFTYNEETQDIDVIDYSTTFIDWTYRIPEDGTVVIRDNKCGDIIETIDVKKNDLVVVFYRNEWVKNPVVIVHNEKWIENLEAFDEYQNNKNKNTLAGVWSETCCNDCPNCEISNN